jgi:hypothetical protein
MTFADRSLHDQYISSSFQDVLQNYVNTGSLLYVLDGLGNVVFSFPSASVGQVIITSDITSSMTVLSASYSNIIEVTRVSSSYASGSLSASFAVSSISSSYSFSSSYAPFTVPALVSTSSLALTASSLNFLPPSSSFSVSASYAPNLFTIDSGSSWNITSSQSTTSSYSATASYALNITTGGTSLTTGSSYPITSSWAQTASYAMAAMSSSTEGFISFVPDSTTTHGILGFVTPSSHDFILGQVSSSTGGISIQTSGSQRIYIDAAGNIQFTGSVSGISVGGTSLTTGSSYPITASWAQYASAVVSSSAVGVVSFVPDSITTKAVIGFTSSTSNDFVIQHQSSSLGGIEIRTSGSRRLYIDASGNIQFTGSVTGLSVSGTSLTTGSSYPITSSWALTSSYAMAAMSSSTAGFISFVPDSTTTHGILGFARTSSHDFILGQVSSSIGGISIQTSGSQRIYVDASGNIQFSGSVTGISVGGTSLTTGSTYPITASWASYVTTAVSASTSDVITFAPSASIAKGIIGFTSVSSNDLLISQQSSSAGGIAFNTSGSQRMYIGTDGRIQFTGSVTGVDSSSYSATASYALNGTAGGTSLTTGSTYPVTASWANYAATVVSSSAVGVVSFVPDSVTTKAIIGFVTTSSNDFVIQHQSSSLGGIEIKTSGSRRIYIDASGNIQFTGSVTGITAGGTSLTTGSTYPITASWAFYVTNAVSASTSDVITFSPSASIAKGVIGFTSVSSNDLLISQQSSSLGGISIQTSGSQRIYIDTSGNIQFTGSISGISSASYSTTASYALNSTSGGTSLVTGSLYPITSSWSQNALTASYIAIIPSGSTESSSYAITASVALRVADSGISIPYYDYSLIDYGGPRGQVASASYFVGTYPSGIKTATITSIYSGSLFIGVSKSLG